MSKRKLSTMQELSDAVGLSRPTVSKYFADPSSVRKATRARIESALSRFDYSPNLLAKNLNRSHSRLIGVLVPTFNDAFYAEFVRIAEQMALGAGYLPVVQSSHGNPALQDRLVSMMLSMNAAGALVVPLDRPRSSENLAALAERIPVVLADSRAAADLPFVGTDNRQSVGVITAYLCETGAPPHFLPMPPVNRNSDERLEAYIAAVDRCGHEPRILKVDGSATWSFESFGKYSLARALEAPNHGIKTLLCSNDRLAIGAFSAAFEAGITIGRRGDLRIAGHDDNPLSAFLVPPLTTVRQNVRAIARASVRRLVAALNGAGDEDGSRQEAQEALPVAEDGDSTLYAADLVVRQSA